MLAQNPTMSEGVTAGVDPAVTAPGTTAAEGRTQAQAAPRRSFNAMTVLGPFATFVAFVAGWYAVSEVVMSENRKFLVPPPHNVLDSAFVHSAHRSELLQATFVTFKVALCGLVIAAIVGVTLAVVMSQAPWLEMSLYPYALLLQVVPILAIVPLLGLLFGFDFKSRVAVAAIICLFPIITNTLFGLKSADENLHDLFTLHRASRWRRLRMLQFPASLPAMFTGLRIAAGAAIVGAIVGDFFFRKGEAGLGIVLDRYRAQLRVPELYGAIIYSALLGIAVFSFFGWLSRRVTGSWASGRRPG